MPIEGLRERKKRETNQAIQKAALRLFARRGYAATTVSDIAQAADVSPRTVALHFPSKEDLLFPDDAIYETLASRLADRRAGESALDALRGWIAERLEEQASEEDRRRDWRLTRTRRAIIEGDPTLRQRERGHLDRAERLIAAAVGEDLGAPPDALVPQITAAAAVAVLTMLGRSQRGGAEDPPSVQEGLALVDGVIEFLHAGMAALSRTEVGR